MTRKCRLKFWIAAVSEFLFIYIWHVSVIGCIFGVQNGEFWGSEKCLYHLFMMKHSDFWHQSQIFRFRRFRKSAYTDLPDPRGSLFMTLNLGTFLAKKSLFFAYFSLQIQYILSDMPTATMSNRVLTKKTSFIC